MVIVIRTTKASTGSSIFMTWSVKREEGRYMRPPTMPPTAEAQGASVAQPLVITIVPIRDPLPAENKSLHHSHISHWTMTL